MISSIQHFIENGVPNLQKASKIFSDNPKDFSGIVNSVKNEALQIALNYISETLTTCDQIYLYIEADEDHVSLRFQETKGDLQVNQYGRKLNGMINKLIYVHEGVEKDAPKSKRHHLVNAHWDEVYAYIDNNYDIDSIKKIYLGADGGAIC